MNDRSDRQKVANFRLALAALEQSLSTPVSEPRDMSGIIKDFELAYELGWKALKQTLAEQGHPSGSAREAFSLAYSLEYLSEEAVWLEMIGDRNLTVHTYNQTLAKAMCERIRQRFSPALKELLALLDKEPK